MESVQMEHMTSLEENEAALYRRTKQELDDARDTAKLRQELSSAESEWRESEEHLRVRTEECVELDASLDDIRRQLLQAESRNLDITQQNEKLALILRARDRTIDENGNQIDKLTSELRDAIYACDETSSRLVLEEERCERRTQAYKAKNAAFQRCKDALIVRTDELSEASREVQNGLHRCDQLRMALEDRDVVMHRAVPSLPWQTDKASDKGTELVTSIGRPERPLLAATIVTQNHDSGEDTQSVVLPSVTPRPKPARPKRRGRPEGFRTMTSHRRNELHNMELQTLASTMPGQVFSSWMLVPLRGEPRS